MTNRNREAQKHIRYSESRRTLGALAADVAHYELHGDRLALENAAEIAQAHMHRCERELIAGADGPRGELTPEQARELHRLARALHRSAAEALGRLRLREREASRPRPFAQPAPWQGMRLRERGNVGRRLF